MERALLPIFRVYKLKGISKKLAVMMSTENDANSARWNKLFDLCQEVRVKSQQIALETTIYNIFSRAYNTIYTRTDINAIRYCLSVIYSSTFNCIFLLYPTNTRPRPNRTANAIRNIYEDYLCIIFFFLLRCSRHSNTV